MTGSIYTGRAQSPWSNIDLLNIISEHDYFVESI